MKHQANDYSRESFLIKEIIKHADYRNTEKCPKCGSVWAWDKEDNLCYLCDQN